MCRINSAKIIILKCVCLDHIWHERETRLFFHNGSSRMIGFIFFTHFCDCFVKTELIYINNCAKVLIFSKSAQWWIDNFPPPLLLSVPRDSGPVARKTGCPLSPNLIISDSATLSPFSLWSVNGSRIHVVSERSPKNDQRPAGNPFVNKNTSAALALHSFSLSFILHMTSLNIDMKMIRPINFSGVTLILTVTLGLCG